MASGRPGQKISAQLFILPTYRLGILMAKKLEAQAARVT
jgi:hypothetical protein